MEAFHLYLQRLLPVAVQVFPESLTLSIRKNGRRKPRPPTGPHPSPPGSHPPAFLGAPALSRLSRDAQRVCGQGLVLTQKGAQSPRSSFRAAGASSGDEGRSRVCVRAHAEPSGIFCSILRTALSTRSRLAGRRASSARQISGDTPSAEGSCSQPNCTTSRSVNLPF